MQLTALHTTGAAIEEYLAPIIIDWDWEEYLAPIIFSINFSLYLYLRCQALI